VQKWTAGMVVEVVRDERGDVDVGVAGDALKDALVALRLAQSRFHVP
jgi:hypothetical protein